MRPHVRSIAAEALAAALLAGLCLAQERAQEKPPTQTLAEEIEVREVELVVELPRLSTLGRVTFGPEDVMVLEDGRTWPVTRIGPVAEGRIRSYLGRDEAIDLPDWTITVYADEVLAKPDTAFYAALALAKRAARLTQLGPVEVVIAAPEPQVLLAANREPRRVEQALTDLVARAGRQRDRPSPPPAGRPATGAGASSRPDAATLRAQCDRLVTRLATPQAGPRLLFLVADGFQVSGQELTRLEAGAAAGETPERAAILLDAARLLAAYGWIAVPLPFREPDELGGHDRAPHDIDRFRDNHSAGNSVGTGSNVPSTIPPRQPRDSELRWEGIIQTKIQPDLSPLRALVKATGGELVGFEAQLDSTLDGLAGRWHLWFQAPDTHDGRLRPIQAQLRSGERLRARQWQRSSTPEGIAEARLRRLLDGASLDHNLPLRAELASAEGSSRLQLTVAPFPSPEPVRPAAVRLSLAIPRADGTLEIRHELLPGIAAPDKGWGHAAALSLPPGTRELAVIVEDLARERWSGAVLEAGGPGAGAPDPPRPGYSK